MALTVPFATATDLADRWRPLSEEETTRATILLEDASRLILDEDTRGIYAEALDPASMSLVRIVCAMVKRAMLAPTGDAGPVSQMQQSAGPFTVSATYSNPAGDVYLTSAERRALGFSRQRAGGFDQWVPPTDGA